MSDHELERATMRKVTLRFLPLLFSCFVIAFQDRVNVGFAALTMNNDLGLSSTALVPDPLGTDGLHKQI